MTLPLRSLRPGLPGWERWTPHALGRKLVAWWDFTDKRFLWVDDSKSAHVGADGDAIGFVQNKGRDNRDSQGEGDLSQATVSERPVWRSDGRGGGYAEFLEDDRLQMNGAFGYEVTYSPTDEVALVCAWRTTDTAFVLYPTESIGVYVGAVDDGSTSTILSSTGGTAHTDPFRVNGRDIYSATTVDRDDLHTAWATGEWNVASTTGVDAETNINMDRNPSPMRYANNNGNFGFAGDVRHYFVVSKPTKWELFQLESWAREQDRKQRQPYVSPGVYIDTGATPIVAELNAGTVALAGGSLLGRREAAFSGGAVALAGADLSPERRGAAEAGALTLSGADVVGSRETALSGGSVTLSGASFSVIREAALSGGSVTLSGSDFLALREVGLSFGAVGVSGSDLLGLREASLDGGALALAGNDITSLRAAGVSSGSLDVSGAALLGLREANLAVGAYALAGAELQMFFIRVRYLDDLTSVQLSPAAANSLDIFPDDSNEVSE